MAGLMRHTTTSSSIFLQFIINYTFDINKYLHSVIKEFPQSDKTPMFALLTFQPTRGLFHLRRVNINERLCFAKGSQDKSSQPEERKLDLNVPS